MSQYALPTDDEKLGTNPGLSSSSIEDGQFGSLTERIRSLIRKKEVLIRLAKEQRAGMKHTADIEEELTVVEKAKEQANANVSEVEEDEGARGSIESAKERTNACSDDEANVSDVERDKGEYVRVDYDDEMDIDSDNDGQVNMDSMIRSELKANSEDPLGNSSPANPPGHGDHKGAGDGDHSFISREDIEREIERPAEDPNDENDADDVGDVFPSAITFEAQSVVNETSNGGNTEDSSQPVRKRINVKIEDTVPRKRKRSDPLSHMNTNEVREEVVGWRVMVYWPLDKQYYEGIIESYSHATNRHKVVYVDGEIEYLVLKRQKWHRKFLEQPDGARRISVRIE